MIYLQLLIGFLKVGCFSFGGAYGAIPIIRDVVLSYGWMSDETISYMIAISESTPGPIMINLATFIGNTQGGIPGAVIATAAVIIPSFIIIIIVTVLLKNLFESRYMRAILDGLKPCIAGVILATGTYMMIQSVFSISFDWKAMVLTVVLAGIMFGSEPIIKKKVSPIALIIISAILGAGLYSL